MTEPRPPLPRRAPRGARLSARLVCLSPTIRESVRTPTADARAGRVQVRPSQASQQAAPKPRPKIRERGQGRSLFPNLARTPALRAPCQAPQRRLTSPPHHAPWCRCTQSPTRGGTMRRTSPLQRSSASPSSCSRSRPPSWRRTAQGGSMSPTESIMSSQRCAGGARGAHARLPAQNLQNLGLARASYPAARAGGITSGGHHTRSSGS